RPGRSIPGSSSGRCWGGSTAGRGGHGRGEAAAGAAVEVAATGGTVPVLFAVCDPVCGVLGLAAGAERGVEPASVGGAAAPGVRGAGELPVSADGLAVLGLNA